jgi:hypothetical protein
VIENVAYAHPKGIGAKYADRNDLDEDISRIRAKSSIVVARPIVRVRGGALPTIVDQAEEHLLEGGYDLFQRGSLIVRPVQYRVPRPDGDQIVNTRLVQVRLQPMRKHFSKAVDFQRIARQSWVLRRLSQGCRRSLSGTRREMAAASPHADHNHTDVAA